MDQVWLDANCRPFRSRTVWTIYLIRDPYGIGYVGCTSRPIAQRWRDHCTDYASGALHSMIKTCGARNCSLTVIDEAIDHDEACRKERKHILARKTLAPNGYNRRIQPIAKPLTSRG